MGRAPCCDKANVTKGPWSPDEDSKLEFIEKHGTGGNWIALPHKAGLRRCGKRCRLRLLNYLRSNLKHGEFSDDEDRLICSLFASIGSRWSIVAFQLPGRTDNDVKNYWNTKLKKKLLGILPTHKKLPFIQHLTSLPSPMVCSSTCHGSSTSFTRTARARHPLTTPNMASSSLLELPPHGVPPHQSPYNQLKGVPMFGADRSCSSSDGSITYKDSSNHLPHYYEHYDHQEKYLENLIDNGLGENPDQKLITTTATSVNEVSLLDIGLEEIKQTISTNDHIASNIHGESTSDVFLSDPSAMRSIKSNERSFMFYSL